jgi:RimJ/RimL family protein N-acetyltransferase
LRAANPADLSYLSKLARDPQVEPFLAPGAGAPERLEVVLGQADPGGLFVVESGSSHPLGGLALHVVSHNSRILDLSRLMVNPAARGSGVGAQAVVLACRWAFVEHGLHRVQAETYGDNLAAQRLFERVGFVREGVRRRAYWRRDRWLDGVLFGILAEELGDVSAVRG